MTFVLLIASGCATASTSSPVAGETAVELNLREGQVSPVPGTDLTIRVEQVTDLTSQGCLGGPIGCRDQLRLDVTRGGDRETVVLFVPHTEHQRQEGVDRARVLGYTITLRQLQGKHVTLEIRRPG